MADAGNNEQAFLDVFKREPIAKTEVPQLRDLWIIRHSVAHNGGIVTQPDPRRLRNASLADKQVLIDLAYLELTSELLRRIVLRLEEIIGPELLTRWFADAAAGNWEADQDAYSRIALLTTCVRSRTKPLPTIDETHYDAAKAKYGT